MNHEEILRRIEEASPDILLVAFGNPKQEQWLAMHRDRLKVPVCIGVGGTLDSLSGTLPRAPRWMQQSGLEWFYRMMLEPQRLAARYLSDALCLVRHFPGYLAASATQPRHRAESNITMHQVGNTQVFSMVGNFTGSMLEEFKACSQAAHEQGANIVLDMSRVGYLGPESLGTLIEMETRMRRREEQLWLAELPAHMSRVLRAGQLQNYFMTTTMVSDALYRTAKAEQRVLARLTPARGAVRQQVVPIGVRMELLQNVCRSIVSVHESEESALAPAIF